MGVLDLPRSTADHQSAVTHPDVAARSPLPALIRSAEVNLGEEPDDDGRIE
jgi:hypothetical protein